jgi:PAS domain S-box-containing protein
LSDLIKVAKECYWNVRQKNLYFRKAIVTLTNSQRKLLDILTQNQGKPVASVDIFFAIWDDYEKEYNEKSVRNIVSKTRKQLGVINIQNIYGGYYMLVKDDVMPDEDFKDYLSDILDQSQNAIVITDPNQKDNPIIYINDAYTKLFNYTEEDVLGKNCRFMHKQDCEQLALLEIKQALKEQKRVTVNIRNYSKEGKLVYNELTISPIFDKKNGKLKYFLGIHKDVTFTHSLVDYIKQSFQ